MSTTGPHDTTRFEVSSPDAVCEVVDGEVIAVDLRTGSYFSLTGTAAFIWNSLVSGSSAAAISKSLAALQGAPPLSEVKDAVLRFIQELETEGLIRRCGRPADSALKLDAGSLVFAVPSCDKFSDMKEFLLVDPIHEVNVRGWPHKAQKPEVPPPKSSGK